MVHTATLVVISLFVPVFALYPYIAKQGVTPIVDLALSSRLVRIYFRVAWILCIFYQALFETLFRTGLSRYTTKYSLLYLDHIAALFKFNLSRPFATGRRLSTKEADTDLFRYTFIMLTMMPVFFIDALALVSTMG